MAVDFDFDTSYNDDEDNDDESNDVVEDEEIEEEEQESGGGSPLRTILLILVLLLLLCVGCWLINRFVPLPIPGIGSIPAATDTPAQDEAPPAGEQPPAEGEAPAEEGVPADGEAADGEEGAPADGEAADGEAAAPDGETGEDGVTEDEAVTGEDGAPADGEAVEGEEGAPADGEAADGEDDTPADGEDGTPADGEDGAPADGEAAEGEEAAPADGEAVEGEDGAPADGEAAEGEEDEELTIIITPVPGPTATPGPGGAAPAQASCDANTGPTADAGGPYNAMMGKGQAVVTFDGANSTDSDGTIDSYDWDFGDGSQPGSGATVRHVYTDTGSYQVTLTVTDNCGAMSQDSTTVTITGSTPPADGDAGDGSDDTGEEGSIAPAPAPAPPVGPSTGTLGFCYKVSRGDTLFGISWYYNVPLGDLAYVNGVTPRYHVIAGEGIFVPTEEPTDGPNVYQVQSGDTLHSIAYLCGISATDLALANNMSPNTSLTPGQYVTVPLPWR